MIKIFNIFLENNVAHSSKEIITYGYYLEDDCYEVNIGSIIHKKYYKYIEIITYE